MSLREFRGRLDGLSLDDDSEIETQSVLDVDVFMENQWEKYVYVACVFTCEYTENKESET